MYHARRIDIRAEGAVGRGNASQPQDCGDLSPPRDKETVSESRELNPIILSAAERKPAGAVGDRSGRAYRFEQPKAWRQAVDGGFA